MGLRSIRRAAQVWTVGLAITGMANGQTRPATGPAQPGRDASPTEATLVSLEFDEAAPERALAALAKQTGFEIRPAVGADVWYTTPTLGPATLSVKEVPFWEAFRQICISAGLAPSIGSSDVLSVHPATKGQNVMKCPGLIHGPFIVLASGVQRRESVSGTSAKKAAMAPLSVKLSGLVEPKLAVVSFSSRPGVLEAVDENGRSLLARDPSGAGDMKPAANGRCNSFEAVVDLDDPAGAGHKIARLKGTLRVLVETRRETFEIPATAGSKDQAADTPAGRIVLEELKEDSGYYRAKIALPAGKLSMASSEVEYAVIRLVDAQGRDCAYSGSPGQRLFRSANRMEIMFSRRSAPTGHRPAGAAVKLVWEYPAAMQEITVPFEFAELAIP